ncbi:Uncharacterised protein [Streptococcus pseudoporcinus]|uniref:Uncharacterized protein n=1 Tax=Streptococcus pseudoporcinus TaxID=361101 RepID=A0A4U9YQD4_9STRE|nr:Uncharacterised protein [Streptococcus pseudoporcinus]
MIKKCDSLIKYLSYDKLAVTKKGTTFLNYSDIIALIKKPALTREVWSTKSY